jgi:superfamily II DNA or RNA helicase
VKSGPSRKLPTIIDNQVEVTLRDAIVQLSQITKDLDVATGFFELGSLLSLDGFWQRIGKVRILLGDAAGRTTRKELVAAFARLNEDSLEERKAADDSLTGIDAVRAALASRKIEVRAYTRERFHAKCYIFGTVPPNPVDFAVVGSSNFTRPGLNTNVELNLLTTDQVHIKELANWFARMWKDADEKLLNDEALDIIARHTREFSPFAVYAKALYEFLSGREAPVTDWERRESRVWPRLSRYQQDGYRTAIEMGRTWGGALVCDGVGLGKTYIGLMLLERFVHDRKRVLLIVPKSGQESVWERHWKPSPKNPEPLLKYIYRTEYGQLFSVRRHTDFGRDDTIPSDKLAELSRDTDVVIIDEAHHFRTPSSNRSKLLARLLREGNPNKQVFLLTATPVNNSLLDLYHLINYFAPAKGHFNRIGVHDYRRIFSGPDRQFENAIQLGDWKDLRAVEQFLGEQPLFKSVLIQRSRKYVKASEEGRANEPVFPVRQRPRVIHYSLRKVYASIYEEIRQAFNRESPFLSLALYCTEAYKRDQPEERKLLDQRKVVGLIRTLLLKRLESSYKAFEASVEDLLANMAQFLKAYAPYKFDGWVTANDRYWKRIRDHQRERLELEGTEDEEENDLPESQQIRPAEHDMDRLLADLVEDMNVLLEFLAKIAKRFYTAADKEDPAKDDKLQKLLSLLTGEPEQGAPDIRGQKVAIFTEFRDTARYLRRQLAEVAGLPGVEEIDSTRKLDREEVIKRFAPYYNCEPGQVDEYLKQPINILISTDVLSEGLNLQDASLIINYDLHWNPVRLIQRIGRVDRRLDPEIERRLERPGTLDRKVFFWNFLPPDDLEDILGLFRRVTGKVLRINAALGIEGALLTPDDPDMTLKEFNEAYEGQESAEEKLRLELERIEREHPDLYAGLPDLPRRLFSGRAGPAKVKPGIFCAWRIWNDTEKKSSEVRWYFRERESGAIHDGIEETWQAVRCEPSEPRAVKLGVSALKPELQAIEARVLKLMRDRGLPLSLKPELVCWLEVG